MWASTLHYPHTQKATPGVFDLPVVHGYQRRGRAEGGKESTDGELLEKHS